MLKAHFSKVLLPLLFIFSFLSPQKRESPHIFPEILSKQQKLFQSNPSTYFKCDTDFTDLTDEASFCDSFDDEFDGESFISHEYEYSLPAASLTKSFNYSDSPFFSKVELFILHCSLRLHC